MVARATTINQKVWSGNTVIFLFLRSWSSRLIPKPTFVLRANMWAFWVFWDTTVHCYSHQIHGQVHTYIAYHQSSSLQKRPCSIQEILVVICSQVAEIQGNKCLLKYFGTLTHFSNGEKCVHWFNHPKCNNNDITPTLQKSFHISKILRLVQVIHTITHCSFAIKTWFWCVCWFGFWLFVFKSSINPLILRKIPGVSQGDCSLQTPRRLDRDVFLKGHPNRAIQF